MAKNKTFNKVQLDVKFTQATTRANLISEENISLAFGKMSKWYEALVPTGGSSGQFLAWNSNGTAKWVSNPNTDTKVNVTLATTSKAYLLGTTTTPTGTATGVTSVADTGVYLGTTAGSLYATSFYENGTALSSKYADIDHTHGLLNSSFNQYVSDASETGWSILGIDVSTNGFILKSLRDGTTNTDWMSGNYGAGIAFGGSDTKGVISMKYSSPVITFAGGNHRSTATSPKWYIKISGTSGKTYNFDNYMGAVKIGNYYGMALPDGTDKGDNSWIRTTRLGLIPYAANTDATDGNVSSLGTSTWTFGAGYINNLYYKDLKTVTVVAGSTDDNGIDKMAGSFFFSGSMLFGGINDWVGIQAGCSNNKFQLVANGITGVLYRHNDAGGTNTTSWTEIKNLMTPEAVSGQNGITVTKRTNTFGTGTAALTYDSGVIIGHSNSVAAKDNYNKKFFTHDAQGHITESSHFVHLATGTDGVSGWVKLATMKHIKTYDNTPIELTMSQRGNHLIYRLHILFKPVNGLDPDIDKFVISMDTTDDTAIRAYIIKSATSTWDLYILKRDSYEAIAVSEFNVGKYFPDHMEWTWQDEQTDASVITGGTEATKHCYGLFLQSNTVTTNYRPIIMGTTQTSDTSKLNATITGQGYVSNSVFVKPSNGYLYANVFSTSSYLNDTGAQLTHYGLYAKSYKKAGLAAGGDYSYSGYIIRIHDGKAADNSGMLLTIGSCGLTIVGSGESVTSLSDLISDDQRDSNASRTRLDVGGTLNTAFQGSSEELILSSDDAIYFLTNCNTIANRKPVVLNTDSYFYPGTTKTGSLGTSSYYWGSAYIDSLYLSKTSELNTASGNALYFATRTDTDVSISFGVGSGGVNHGIYSYKLNAWIIFGDDSNVYVRSTLYNPTTKSGYFAIPFFGSTPSTGAKAIYNNNGLRYSTLEGTTSQPGVAHLIIGNGVASTSDANKEGIIRIYSVENGFVDLSTESSVESNTLTLPALTGTLRIQRNALQYDNSSDFASYSWHKFAETTSNVANDDRYITFLVSRTYRGNVIGILTAHIRTTGTKVFSSAEFEWSLANKGIIPSNFVMVYTDTANTSCKVELWYKQEACWDGWIFEVLKENTRTVIDYDNWILYPSVGHGSETYTSGTGTIISKLGYIQNAPGIYAVKGTQTASTSSWTGSIDVSELYDGLTIAYYLPYASTSTSVTLNLTLVDGTTTGAINCYYTSTSRITTHYAVGATIVLTYWSAGSISVNGTATTDNRWVRCEFSTTSANQTNTTTNADYRVLFSTNANDTTQGGTTRKNINLKYNPSTANLQIGAFVSGSTATEDGKLTFGNSSNVYTHTINTDITKVNNISLLLNDANGVMGTDTLCYKGYESENLSSDTELGALSNISSLPGNVSFSGYLARFSYFTILLCVGTDVTQRLTINLTAVSGYQSFQLIWGGAPSSSGGQLCMTSGLANITDNNGTITITLGCCASYWYISSSSSSLTRGSTPGLHILKVYGHSIRSQGYH